MIKQLDKQLLGLGLWSFYVALLLVLLIAQPLVLNLHAS